MTCKTAAVFTLGCRLNQADSALISARLQRMGFQIVSLEKTDSSPNLIVINSCAVTAVALKKSMQTLRSIRAEHPQSFLIFTGCTAALDGDKLENSSDIDLVLPNSKKTELESILPRYLANLNHPVKHEVPVLPDGVYRENIHTLMPFKTRATLKIQDGCDNFCSYCIVPFVRGHERSRDFEETVADFHSLVDAGFHEIVISGCNLCHYRSGTNGLPQLLNAFLDVPGDWRIRLGSTEPGKVLPEVLEIIKKSDGKICQFLHMPLQHGTDAVLKSMNRHCLTSEYVSYAEQARSLMPFIHLGTDIIVGYPGETDDLFCESFDFLKKMKFANIHVFPYSPRPGTKAAKMEQIHKNIVDARVEKIKALKAELSGAFVQSLCGQTESVLIELRKGPSAWEGWSGNYVKTIVAAKEDISKQLVNVHFHNVLPTGEITAEIL